MTHISLIGLFIGFIIFHAIAVLFGTPIEKAISALVWQGATLVSVAVIMWIESL